MPTSKHTLGTGVQGFVGLEDTVKMDTVYDAYDSIFLAYNVQTCVRFD